MVMIMKVKNILSLAFCLVFLCSFVYTGAYADEAGDGEESESQVTEGSTGVTINVYNWGEYISNGTEDSMDVNEEFTRRTGIGVNYTTFDSNESQIGRAHV